MFLDFLDLLYPRICFACETALTTNEKVVCTSCLHDLPVTNYHLENNNPVEKIFYGRIPVEQATALLLFEKKGVVQNLIHHLKYRGQEEIGHYFGTWMGAELSALTAYSSVTIVIPVPLHHKKLKSRGYNQVTGFGKEIAEALKVPFVDNLLLKVSATKTQTIKKRLARWGNIEETLILHEPERFAGAHVLLVDDLVTTGATLEACAHKLQLIPDIKISIATMAVTN
jgi:ComF family protein